MENHPEVEGLKNIDYAKMIVEDRKVLKSIFDLTISFDNALYALINTTAKNRIDQIDKLTDIKPRRTK